MKPIISRFCEIYVPEPVVNGQTVNLYKYNLNEVFKMKDIKAQKYYGLSKEISKINKKITLNELIMLCTKFYEKGYSALDILTLLENPKFLENLITNEKRYELLICFNRVRREFRNEKLLILFILNFIFFKFRIMFRKYKFYVNG